jgi:lipopolysaccharide export system protein LptA
MSDLRRTVSAARHAVLLAPVFAVLLLPVLAVPLLPVLAMLAAPAAAQELDLSHGGPIAITAANGIEWRQAEHEVIAQGDARAVRGDVTVTADRLTAWYRKKGGAAGNASQATPAAVTSDTDTGGNEVYRVQAEGNVHIYTQTDQLWGDLATFDLDQAVVVATGHNLRLTTPNDLLTSRDDMEYWTQKHMAVARGDAVVVSKDGRRLQADTLVAYTVDTDSPAAATPAAEKSGPGGKAAAYKAGADKAGADKAGADKAGADKPAAAKAGAGADPLATNGKLKKVEAYGHVVVRTALDTVTGERAVYVPETGIARVIGDVRITRGQNQLAGSEAVVDVKTGVSHLLAGNTGRVQGLVVPNDQASRALAAPAQPAKPGTGPQK